MNAMELEAKWMHRDNLYALRRTHGQVALTDVEQASIRWWRTLEVVSLPYVERLKAQTILSSWTAPRGRR